MPDTIRREIEAKARKAIVNRAVFRLENALIIAGSLLLAAFFPQPLPQTLPWFNAWPWLALGALGLGGMVWSTLSDPREAAQAVAEMFHEEHDPRLIKDRQLRAKYDRALEYYDRLQEVSAKMNTERLRDRTGESVRQMEDWVSNIYRLALRLQAFREDSILNRDRQQTPETLRSLQARAKLEADPGVRQQLQTTIASKRQQLDNIQALDNLMQRADLQLDNSIAALGTVYSQMLLIGSKREIDSTAAQRLQENVTDEVLNLQDLVESINEVYDYRYEGLG
ncbi:MAG: hypothetical protein HUU23_13455 [Caldilineales bacterium]|nr:hypothetical protein [Caldilineales bacterium]